MTVGDFFDDGAWFHFSLSKPNTGRNACATALPLLRFLLLLLSLGGRSASGLPSHFRNSTLLPPRGLSPRPLPSNQNCIRTWPQPSRSRRRDLPYSVRQCPAPNHGPVHKVLPRRPKAFCRRSTLKAASRWTPPARPPHHSGYR